MDFTYIDRIPVYSFIAYSGTGKTTYIEKLIPILKANGLRVAVMKHDAHEFEIDKPGKDSWRMTNAGADVTLIASATHAAIMENRPVDSERMLARVQNVDVILTEGYKHGPWKKVGIARADTGKGLPEIEGEFFAVVADYALSVKAPAFSLDDQVAFAEYLLSDLKKEI